MEVEKELTGHILPFWMEMKDEQNGGFYGIVDFNLNTQKQADKSGIVTARFLWTFSAAYRVTKNKQYLGYADHVYNFLINKIYDDEYSGLYWLVDYQGNPKDTRKHIYTQSFGIYALSEYYRATKNESALKLAIELFELIESRGFSKQSNAYMEEFDRKWNPAPNEMLSENGVIAEITMNTHIHVLEAYTNLYKAWPNKVLKARLNHLLDVHFNKIYNQESKFLHVFFDKDWNSLLNVKSFGHDIEASWLMDETIKTLELTNEDYLKMVVDIAYNIADYAIQDDGSLINEELNDVLDPSRVWWVQAEAIVGFYNAFERTGDQVFLKLVDDLWAYTKKFIIDQRPQGEWYWSVDEKGIPSERNISDPWKASYHNGRFCLEMMERMSKHDT
jgi:mannobiose 2-epimerase